MNTVDNKAFEIPWWNVLAGVWLAGAAAVLLFTLVQGIAFRRKIKKYRILSEGPVCNLINGHKQTLGIKRVVTAVEYDKLHTPAVFGYFRPVILLPRRFLQTDAQTISCILLHELCHIKRRDILKSYVWLAAKALHWFNPLVWVAFKMVKDDVELCCDDTVTRRLETDGRYAYTQSLVDVFRLSKQGDSLPVTVSLFESRARLTQRVMRMLSPKRRLKSAVVVSALLAITMIVAGFTTACSPAAQAQPAPKETNTQMLAERATSAPEQGAKATPTPAPKLDYDTPEKWTDSFEGDEGKLKVNVDADIVLPRVSEIATYHVQPDAAFTQEMADRLISALFGDAQVYQMTHPTKEVLQRKIDRISGDYELMQSGVYDFPDDWDDAQKQSQTERTKSYLNSLEVQLSTASDISDLVPLDTKIDVAPYGTGSIQGMADLGREEWANFHLVNHSNTGTSVNFKNDGNYFLEFGDGVERKAPIGDLHLSETEARQTADELLARLGLTDFVCCSASITGKTDPVSSELYKDKYAHMLVYTRNLSGIPLAPFMAEAFTADSDTISKEIKYRPEFIFITVNDQGVCDFEWGNKMQPGDMAEPNVKLMPFVDISELIKQKIAEKYTGVADSHSNEIGSGDNWWKTDEYILNIHRVALEYAMMPDGGDY